MAGKDYLCGKRFTMADILLYCWLEFGGQVGQPLDPANAQYRGVDGARRRAAVGEGVGYRHSEACAVRCELARSTQRKSGLLRCFA